MLLSNLICPRQFSHDPILNKLTHTTNHKMVHTLQNKPNVNKDSLCENRKDKYTAPYHLHRQLNDLLGNKT